MGGLLLGVGLFRGDLFYQEETKGGDSLEVSCLYWDAGPFWDFASGEKGSLWRVFYVAESIVI